MPEAHNHAETAMGGLVLRIDVAPSAAWQPYTGPRERSPCTSRAIRPGRHAAALRLRARTRRAGSAGGLAAVARPADHPARGQPTSIIVINRTAEPSQVHWHGLEIDSYYDGVAGLAATAAWSRR